MNDNQLGHILETMALAAPQRIKVDSKDGGEPIDIQVAILLELRDISRKLDEMNKDKA